MAKNLQRLLSNDSPNFSISMHALERSTGHEGLDVRLIGDVIEKSTAVVRKLGLDPSDTTPRELYMALNNYVAKQTRAPLLLDADYLLWGSSDDIVSLNLIDVIENYHHQLPFEQRSLVHAQRALRGELLARYYDHPSTHDSTVTSHAAAADIHREEDAHHTTVKEFIKSQGHTSTMDDKKLLFIGDIFTDAFIMLDEKYAKIQEDENGEEWLMLPFGQKPPYDHADIVPSVGPSPNSAISCTRLGLQTSLMAWLGDDKAGKESLDHLKKEGVDTSMMVTEEGNASSYWYVLRYKADRTMLVKSEKYKYEWIEPKEEPSWIYLSYIGEDSWPFHEKLLEYLNAHPDVKLAFQPGSFHFEWGTDKLREIYRRSHIVIMNREEAVDVTGRDHGDIPALIDGLHELGPHIVVMTDGSHGSYASYDFKKVRIDNYPDPAPPLDRTGAGDAFASTIVAALAMGESMDTALTWAPINSMNVVQYLGAQKGLLKKDELMKYLADAPDDYGVKPL